jgi:hypothetical protein
MKYISLIKHQKRRKNDYRKSHGPLTENKTTELMFEVSKENMYLDA